MDIIITRYNITIINNDTMIVVMILVIWIDNYSNMIMINRIIYLMNMYLYNNNDTRWYSMII